MTDRPILFSGPMVRALLDGRKTQTRRVLLNRSGDVPAMEPTLDGSVPFNDPSQWGFRYYDKSCDCEDVYFLPQFAEFRFKVGDRLYVREAWKSHAAYDDLSPAAMGGDEPIRYEADGSHQTWGHPAIDKIGRFRQGMHMPRWASRLTLIITDVRVQRLQECSVSDALAEGAIATPVTPEFASVHAISMYRAIWDGLNADRGFGWSDNPWVVAVTFDVVHGNIDQLPATLKATGGSS